LTLRRKLFFLGEDFSVREMRKTYDIPENASFEHMTSFLTSKGTLVVEFPLVTETKQRGMSI